MELIGVVSQYGIAAIFAMVLLKFVVKDIPKKIDSLQQENKEEFDRHYDIMCKLIEAKNDHIETELKNKASIEGMISKIHQQLSFIEGRLNNRSRS